MEADFRGNHSICAASDLLWLSTQSCVRQWFVSTDVDQNKSADKRRLSLSLQDAAQINCEIGQISCISQEALLCPLCSTK